MVREQSGGIKNRLVCHIQGRYNRSMEKTIRAPIVAGAFYPGNPTVLRATIESFFEGDVRWSNRTLNSPIGLIAPHAGYPYSGSVAAAGYGRVAALGRPEAVVLLGANHTGLGAPLSLSGHAIWETPLGRSPVDARLVAQLTDSGIPIADAAFGREHSTEVQLPLVQSIWGCDLPIVPLCVMSVPLPSVQESVEVIARAIAGRALLVVASSDFTHYEPDATARELDRLALEPIQALDAEGFERIYRERRLSICGAGAILLLLGLCRRLGLTEGELVQYATSGDVTGDRGAVVGYASVLFTTGGS
jgi:AmmeMemoRadiSam system protein B